MGKVILAHLSEQDLEAFLRSVTLRLYTPNTITDPTELKLHLGMIRERGYAIDDSEHEAEVKCAAAPVRDKDGKVIAGISISGPVFRLTREKIEEELVPAVTETARILSMRLGYVERA